MPNVLKHPPINLILLGTFQRKQKSNRSLGGTVIMSRLALSASTWKKVDKRLMFLEE